MNTVAAARRILVVDDDDTTRRGLVALLVGAGFVALPAGSLQEATAVLERDAPDLIITDIRLQGYNGLQILAMGSRPLPALVVTGYPDRSIEADARKMGAEYRLKTIAPSAMLTLVHQKHEASTPDSLST